MTRVRVEEELVNNITFLLIKFRRIQGFRARAFCLRHTGMIEGLVAGIPDAEKGFACYFSDQPFPGSQLKLDWDHEESGGNWYKLGDQSGWLCPALFKYFSEAPASIYAKAERHSVIPR